MIELSPTATRYVRVRHPAWGCEWQLQWPESIACREGWIMDYQAIHPEWRTDEEGALSYTWRADAAYVARQQEYRKDPSYAHKHFLEGFRLEASLRPREERVELSLALSNESNRPITHGVCDGGCFQAKSPEFAGPSEVGRTFLHAGGVPIRASGAGRTVAERALWHHDPREYDIPPDDEGQWFWGRSGTRPDLPVCIAMESLTPGRAVGIGYSSAASASANADDHHCIHSRPVFGDLAPGETSVCKGLICFGHDAAAVFSRLRSLLDSH